MNLWDKYDVYMKFCNLENNPLEGLIILQERKLIDFTQRRKLETIFDNYVESNYSGERSKDLVLFINIVYKLIKDNEGKA